MRKGVSAENAMVTIVTFGVLLIMIAVIYTDLLGAGKQEFTKRQCQSSLELARAFDKASNWWCVKAAENPAPLTCTRRFLTVTEDDVLEDGKSVKGSYDLSCPGGNCLPEAVLAQEMARCWDTFFQGEVPVFQQVEQGIFDFFDDEDHSRACFVCSEVQLDTGRNVESFRTSYLETQKWKGVTYYEFLAKNPKAICTPGISGKADDGTCWSGIAEPHAAGFWSGLFGGKDWPAINQESLKDHETYAVTVIRQGMSTCQGRVFDDTLPTLTVQVIPAENIGDHCDMVMV